MIIEPVLCTYDGILPGSEGRERPTDQRGIRLTNHSRQDESSGGWGSDLMQDQTR